MNNMQTVPTFIPVITPLLALLRSRKFLAILITGVVDALILLAPELEPVQVELVTALTAMAVALVGAIAYEDGQSSVDVSEG